MLLWIVHLSDKVSHGPRALYSLPVSLVLITLSNTLLGSSNVLQEGMLPATCQCTMRSDRKGGRTYILEIYGMTQQSCLFCHRYNFSLFLSPGNARFTWSTWTSGTSRRKGKVSSVYVLKRPSNVVSVFCWIFSASLYIFQFSNVFFKRSPFISIPSGEKKAEGLETPQG